MARPALPAATRVHGTEGGARNLMKQLTDPRAFRYGPGLLACSSRWRDRASPERLEWIFVVRRLTPFRRIAPTWASVPYESHPSRGEARRARCAALRDSHAIRSPLETDRLPRVRIQATDIGCACQWHVCRRILQTERADVGACRVSPGPASPGSATGRRSGPGRSGSAVDLRNRSGHRCSCPPPCQTCRPPTSRTPRRS